MGEWRQVQRSVENNKRSGLGLWIGTNGQEYNGEWKEDKTLQEFINGSSERVEREEMQQEAIKRVKYDDESD
jgi:hypothetical protein